MPINIPENLPAKEVLEKEHIFVMDQERALYQDIRALKIALVNLMPTTRETETQILRMLSNTPLQVEIEFLHMDSHRSVYTPQTHFASFYKTFADVRESRFDGLIVIGAPVEQLNFKAVDYWTELAEVMKWADRNVTSSLFLCWAAQAALHFYHAISKYPLQEKIFGVFSHNVINRQSPLLRGFDDTFFVPHSRHTEVRAADISRVEALEILVASEDAGVHIVAERDGSKVYMMGHPEYDDDTLQREYERDVKNNLPIRVPKNYFLDDDPAKAPKVTWRSHGFLFYFNWLNYYVYQTTPYNWINAGVLR